MDKPDLYRDETFLKQQYQTQDLLAIRVRTHQLYEAQPVDFPAWVLDHLSWRGEEQVLDVGCGSGVYVNPARTRTPHYIAGDLSLGMLQALAAPQPPRLNLDAQRLPLATASVDVLLANHMLYHVPDLAAAVAEFVRVLRPGGYLLAATNSAHTMAELDDLSVELVRRLWPADEQTPLERLLRRAHLPFHLENGQAWLAPYFASVLRYDLPGVLVFPEPQPVIDYVATVAERFVPVFPAGVTWEQAVAILDDILTAHIAAHGAFRVHKLAGLFVCRTHG